MRLVRCHRGQPYLACKEGGGALGRGEEGLEKVEGLRRRQAGVPGRQQLVGS